MSQIKRVAIGGESTRKEPMPFDKTPKMRRKSPVQWERRLQQAVVHFHATIVVDPLEAILFAVPNGEKRDEVTAGLLSGKRRRKARPDVPGAIQPPPLTDAEMMRPAGLGVLAGVQDMILLLAGGVTVLLELKIPKTEQHRKGSFSIEQKAYRRSVTALGHTYRCIESIEAYQAVLIEFGVRLRIRSIFPAKA